MDDLASFIEDTLGYEEVDADDWSDGMGLPAIAVSYGDEDIWHISIFLIGNSDKLYELQTESDLALTSNSGVDTEVYGAMTESFELL